jgi:hypothetical protein
MFDGKGIDHPFWPRHLTDGVRQEKHPFRCGLSGMSQDVVSHHVVHVRDGCVLVVGKLGVPVPTVKTGCGDWCRLRQW